MPYHAPTPSGSYRWQDHVITPRRAAANLLATLAIAVAVSAAVLLAGPPHPATAHAVAAEYTPPLSQLAKPPPLPRTTGAILRSTPSG
jgi:hypothetical protein